MRGRGGTGRLRTGALALGLALGAGLGGAPSPAAAQELHVIVVTGLGGEPRYREAFHRWAVEILDAARDRLGVSPERTIYLGERTELDPERMRDRSTRENVASALREIAGRSRPGDRVLVVLIGHGTASQDGARFNLPGPDPSAAEWGGMLAALEGREVALVNTASASGDFIPAVAGEGRIVVTATRSGREQNETVFPRFFAAALTDTGADLDKDGQVSLLEAFEYTRQEVARFYREEGRIQTEVALLDDTGDGVGSRAPGVDGDDGARARAFRMGGVGAAAAGAVADDPALAPLLERRRELEDRVVALRGERETLGEAEYERRLEELLIDLALVSREIRERGGSP